MADGMTVIDYGSVRLLRCTTRGFHQTPDRDASHTDLKSWKYLIRVSGIVHGFVFASDVGGQHAAWCEWQQPSVSAADRGDAAIAHRLVRYRLPPRQNFSMRVGANANGDGGTVLLSAATMGNLTPVGTTPNNLSAAGLSGYDLNNGPVCTEFAVTQVIANNIFKVEAEFEIHKIECDDDSQATGNTTGVLSNRWSCADDIDTDMRTVRTYSGTLEIATASFSPHWFRYLCVPPLSDGFRRDRMHFLASEDGLKLQYSITDTEIAASAPAPATRWSVEHSEGSSQGMMGHSSVNISLQGDGNCDKSKLIEIALYVLTNKLMGKRPIDLVAVNETQYILDDFTITDHIGDVQAITATAKLRRLMSNLDNLNIAAARIGKPILAADLPAAIATYDPRKSRGGRIGETPEYQGPASLVGIFRCYLQDPCNTVHGIRAAGSSQNSPTNQLGVDLNGETFATPQASITALVVPSLGETPIDYYSDSHQEAAYTFYRCESQYRSHQMRAAMPKASPPYEGEGDDNSDATVIVSLGRPQSRLIVRVTAERIGKQPELPDPETLYSEEATHFVSPGEGGGTGRPAIRMKLLSSTLAPATVHYTAMGQKVYRARLQAKYALTRKPGPTELLKIGSNPWTKQGVEISSTTLTNSSWGEVPVTP